MANLYICSKLPKDIPGEPTCKECLRDGDKVSISQEWPCGCVQIVPFCTSGPLKGFATADIRSWVCDTHAKWCEECGQQTWPHNDCVCDTGPDEETGTFPPRRYPPYDTPCGGY